MLTREFSCRKFFLGEMNYIKMTKADTFSLCKGNQSIQAKDLLSHTRRRILWHNSRLEGNKLIVPDSGTHG